MYKNVTLFELISEKIEKYTIDAIFTSNNVNLSENKINEDEKLKRKIYVQNLSFSQWLERYGYYSMIKIIKNIIIILFFLAFIFVIININIFCYAAKNPTINTNYHKADSLISSAEEINTRYIFYLIDNYNYRSFISLPFYKIRDFLYNKSISLIGSDKAIEELYWNKIKFEELDYVYNYFYECDKNTKPIENKAYEYIKSLQKETYNHIYSFAETDFKDNISDVEKLSILADMILIYAKSAEQFEADQLYRKFYQTHDKETKIKYPRPSYAVVANNINFIELFDKVKNEIKQRNPEAYNEFETTKKAKENIIKIELIKLFFSEYIERQNEINYSSNEFKLSVDLIEELCDYTIKNAKNIPDDELWKITSLISYWSNKNDKYSPEINKKLDNIHKEIEPYAKKASDKYLTYNNMVSGIIKSRWTKYGVCTFPVKINH